MRFADVIGQDGVKRMMVRGADSGRISHAQLLAGCSGYGVLPLAVAYAQYLNCEHPSDGDSCGVCPSCVKMGQLAHPDLHFVFPVGSAKSGSKTGSDFYLPQWRELFTSTGGYFDERMWYGAIDIANQQGIISRAEAEEVIKKLSFKSFEAKYKVVVVWMAERMRVEAANALLKILEEPWERTVFLLVSESPYRLLPTIVSRTQEIAVPAVGRGDTERFLSERHGLDGDRLGAVARIACGDLIEAGRLAAGGVEGEDEYFESFTQLMRLSYNDRHMELLEWADNMAATGRESQKRFLSYAVRMLRESYMLHAGMGNITYLWGAELDFCRKFSPFIGNGNIERLVAEMELASAQIAQNGNARIIFSHFALTVSKMINKL